MFVLDVCGFKRGTVLVTAGETPLCGKHLLFKDLKPTVVLLIVLGKSLMTLQIDPVNALSFPVG